LDLVDRCLDVAIEAFNSSTFVQYWKAGKCVKFYLQAYYSN
jgi:hypothetical protein